MARKALWDADTIRQELEDSYNDLQNIPARHLKRLIRLTHLYEHSERWTTLEALQQADRAYAHGHKAGSIMAMQSLRVVMQAVIDGTFEAISEEGSDHGPYDERTWDERFGE